MLKHRTNVHFRLDGDRTLVRCFFIGERRCLEGIKDSRTDLYLSISLTLGLLFFSQTLSMTLKHNYLLRLLICIYLAVLSVWSIDTYPTIRILSPRVYDVIRSL